MSGSSDSAPATLNALSTVPETSLSSANGFL